MIYLWAAIIGILVSMLLVLMRALAGPSVFDRIMAGNQFGTKIIVLILLVGELMQTEFYLDVALTYALINFIATVALLRYFKFSSFRESAGD